MEKLQNRNDGVFTVCIEKATMDDFDDIIITEIAKKLLPHIMECHQRSVSRQKRKEKKKNKSQEKY